MGFNSGFKGLTSAIPLDERSAIVTTKNEHQMAVKCSKSLVRNNTKQQHWP